MEGPDGRVADPGEGVDAGPSDPGAALDPGVETAAAADAGGDATGDSAPVTPTFDEVEPNGGGTLDEVNVIEASYLVRGAVGTAGDADIFQLDTAPGAVYEVTLRSADGSALHPHLTVMDDGRGGDPAGGDYVKIAVSDGPGRARLVFLAMGEPGVFLVVRDARNVGGATAVEGSAEHTYELSIAVHPIGAWVRAPLVLPGTFTDALKSAGDLALYPFEGGKGGLGLRVDLRSQGDMDGRLIVFSEETGDWVARNGDRSLGDPDPLLDAPMSAGGRLYLVVENVAERAESLGYQVSAVCTAKCGGISAPGAHGCMTSHCAPEVSDCDQSPACKDMLDCLAGCAAGDGGCEKGCLALAKQSEVFFNLLGCAADASCLPQ